MSALSDFSDESTSEEPNDSNAPEMTSPTLPPASRISLSTTEREKLLYTQKSYRWNRKNYSRNARRIQIWMFVVQFLAESWAKKRPWTYVGGYSDAKKQARQRRQAVWIREAFLDLGRRLSSWDSYFPLAPICFLSNM